MPFGSLAPKDLNYLSQILHSSVLLSANNFFCLALGTVNFKQKKKKNKPYKYRNTDYWADDTLGH
jgi:hypothetical protein